MPVYTLFLSNSTLSTANGYKDDSMIVAGFRYQTLVSNLNQPEFYYNINWDNLFKDENYNPKYTKCRIRCKINQGDTQTDGTYGNHLGRMNVNLISENYLSGTTIGCPINLYNYALTHTGIGYININNSLYSATGVEIEIPKGSSTLFISYPHYSRIFTLSNPAFCQFSPYGLLSFELI